MAKKKLQDIHTIVTALCEATDFSNNYISEHLNRTYKNDHASIDHFQDVVCNYLKAHSPEYGWATEKKANGRKEKDSIDIHGESKSECCIIEIDATRIDQITQKFVSRMSLWGLGSEKPLLYVAILYPGSECHRRKEDCEKYIRYCYDLMKACKGNDSSVVGIYTNGKNIEVWDYDRTSSFQITCPGTNSVSYKSMVKSAMHAVKWYADNKAKDFHQLKKVFRFVDIKKSPSKYEMVNTKIGNIYVSTDWREYGSRAYWNDFVSRCKKEGITIEKQVIKYQSDLTNPYIYSKR